MDLRVLRNFLKIAELENITQASRELNVAQPHLTRQIKTLEEELGVELFIRDKKRLHITEEGKFLKQQAEQIFKLVNKTTPVQLTRQIVKKPQFVFVWQSFWRGFFVNP